MLLIGMFDSPFVRRVAISMKLLGIPFEHANWSVGKDLEQIRKYSPLGRVPALVLDGDDTLVESSAILDYLDQLAGPHRALLPASGRARRDALQIIANAIGAGEKGRDIIYERAFRPPEKRHDPWLARVRMQMHSGLMEIETYIEARGHDRWLINDRVTQADITTGCIFTFLVESVDLNEDSAPYPALRSFVARCEALPEFQATRVAWSAPAS